MLTTQRVYEKHTPTPGRRFLVERLWPRGIRKEDLKIDAWLKDVAPSTALRQWFGHDPAKWSEFQRRYFAELDQAPEAWRPLLEAARASDVVLLYSSHDTEHNNAVALLEYLQNQLGAHRARALRPRAAVRSTQRRTALPTGARSR